jgi:hypothetical protein
VVVPPAPPRDGVGWIGGIAGRVHVLGDDANSAALRQEDARERRPVRGQVSAENLVGVDRPKHWIVAESAVDTVAQTARRVQEPKPPPHVVPEERVLEHLLVGVDVVALHEVRGLVHRG